MDLRIYHASGVFVDTSVERMDPSSPELASATGLEVIAGKVVKYLLTYRGTDAFDPDYGGTALHTRFISPAYLSKFTLELKQDIEDCIAYVHRAESSLPDGTERLDTVILSKVQYNNNTRDRIDITLEIVTTSGNSAVVHVQGGNS